MAKLSTRKRGKKNPTWYYSFDAGTMPDGKRKRVEKGGFATEKEARVAGTKAMASFLKGNIAIISEKITVRDFLAEWLERKKLEVAPKTIVNYRGSISRMDPIIGDKYVQKIRPRDVDEMIRQLAGQGLSHGTLTVMLNCIKSAFSYAVYPAELIQANPAQYIKIPRNAPRNIVKRHIIRGEKLKEALDAFPLRVHVPYALHDSLPHRDEGWGIPRALLGLRRHGKGDYLCQTSDCVYERIRLLFRAPKNSIQRPRHSHR